MKTSLEHGIIKNVPCNGKNLFFRYPSFIGIQSKVSESVINNNLEIPTSAETASLIYDAFTNNKKEYYSEITESIKNDRLWEFTGNLYLPESKDEISNGVLIDLNPKNLKFNSEGRLVMDKNSLIKRLLRNDPSVKFIPLSNQLEMRRYSNPGRNPYLLARYGYEGAGKIIEISSRYHFPLKIWNFNSVKKETAMLSAMIVWGFEDGIIVSGLENKGRGHLFGRIPR